jgi:hypothetical protein
MVWRIRTSDDTSITVEFDGRLDVVGGQDSATALARELEKGPRAVVWDVRKMTGYDSEARVAWRKTLWPLRENISSVRLIGGGPLIRVGALTLAGLLGLTITLDES